MNDRQERGNYRRKNPENKYYLRGKKNLTFRVSDPNVIFYFFTLKPLLIFFYESLKWHYLP